MTAAVLSQFVDLNEVGGDAWQYNWPVGSMRPEDTDPQMVAQPQATDPTYFPRQRYLPGWKLALDRIMRMGGPRGVPAGPSRNAPRLRRQLTDMPYPSQHMRDVPFYDQPSGLIDDTPSYERYMHAVSDDYIGS